MKHERFVVAADRVSTSFVRSFAICLLAGAGCWTAVISTLI